MFHPAPKAGSVPFMGGGVRAVIDYDFGVKERVRLPGHL